MRTHLAPLLTLATLVAFAAAALAFAGASTGSEPQARSQEIAKA
jgi:hypothetical protein